MRAPGTPHPQPLPRARHLAGSWAAFIRDARHTAHCGRQPSPERLDRKIYKYRTFYTWPSVMNELILQRFFCSGGKKAEKMLPASSFERGVAVKSPTDGRRFHTFCSVRRPVFIVYPAEHFCRFLWDGGQRGMGTGRQL